MSVHSVPPNPFPNKEGLAVLDRKIAKVRNAVMVYWLVQWSNGNVDDDTWEVATDLQARSTIVNSQQKSNSRYPQELIFLAICVKLIESVNKEDLITAVPVAVLDRKIAKVRNVVVACWLVQWSNRNVNDDSWEVATNLQARDQELASSHGFSVINYTGTTDDKVAISFDDQSSSRKNQYLVDCCYGKNEDNHFIFSKEVKPHISGVFVGESSTFIAFRARGSGKTYTIQGSKENLGLGMLAIDEILRSVEGGRHTVAVLMYEVLHNHVYDLLDTNKKEVQILEDAQGKITLKGLSKAS
ncbi:kinesin-like protein KIN-10C [Tanacetum coccineum]